MTALALLLALSTTPARAQWVAYKSTNSLPTGTQYSTTPSPSYAPPWSTSIGAYDGGGVPEGGSIDLGGTVTLTFQWIGGPGVPVTPLYVLLQGGAAMNWLLPGAAATVSDGLGDPAVPTLLPSPPYFPTREASIGAHLVQRAAPAGTAAGTLLSLDPVTLTCSGPGAPTLGSEGLTGTVDTRGVTLHRNNAVGDTTDANGTVHGATTFSYGGEGGLGASTVDNVQAYGPYFAGGWSPNPQSATNSSAPVFNIRWSWSPANTNDPNLNDDDTWGSHYQHVPLGTVMMSSQSHWVGKPDAVKHIITTYTVTDLGNPATATATYDLAVHDQYDNFRRVNASGIPVTNSSTTAGDPGGLTQVGQSTAPMPSQPVVTYNADQGLNWTAAGDVGGGVLAGTSAYLLALEAPIWPATILNLIGISLQTGASYPTNTTNVTAPNTMSAAYLQQAYQNYLNNLTALPGQQFTPSPDHPGNTVDAGFARVLANNPDYGRFFNGYYGTLNVTTTLDIQMLDYHFYCDQYNTAGLVSTTVSSSVTKPGGLVWNYLWNNPTGTPTPTLNP